MRRYFLILAFLIAALLLAIPVITVYLLSDAYDEQIKSGTKQTSMSIQRTVRSFVDGAYNLSYELSLNKNTLDVNEEGISEILADAVRRNEFFELLYITDSRKLSDKFGRQVSRSYGSLGDRSSRWWFLQTTQTEQPFVGRSYISIATGMPCAAIFIPMRGDSGEMTHIFGADISLAYIQGLTYQFANRGEGRFSFIIDGEGVVIAHPDDIYLETLTNYKTLTRTVPAADAYGNALLNPDGSVATVEEKIHISDEFRNVITAVMNGKSGLEMVSENGKTYYMSYESIPLPGYSNSWSVITLQDRKAAMSGIYQLIVKIAIIIILIVVVLFALIVGFLKTLRRNMAYLEGARIEAEQASRSKSIFLANMSHEMRTPMNAIIGMTEIGKNTDSVEEKNSALNKISVASSHLLGVINDVLDMAKIEADKLEIMPTEYNFEQMLQKVISIIHFKSNEKQQKLCVNIDENIPRFVIGDDQRLAQVITNLMSNAVKFTPKGGEIELNASLVEINGDICELCIEITDNGIGISQENQKKLFSPFVQADCGINREYGGTGLGLAIAKRIVELMDGKIWVESEFGSGAKFTFTIKAGVSSLQTNCVSEQAENIGNGRGEFAGKKMLLVEDIKVNREIMTSLLKNTKIEIDEAENGAEAYETVSESPKKYDIVLMDIQMPIMDGYKATKLIRQIPECADLPIIAMTANVFKDDIEACISAGMNEHLSKPVDTAKVLEVLRKYLRK